VRSRSAQVVVRALSCSIGSLISVIEYLVFLAVDQQLVQVATLRVVPELADPLGALDTGEHEDVEQLGAGSRPERRGEPLAAVRADRASQPAD
jgi:hypothetical protein